MKIGLLTSVHCVAMCGGINLSQCLPQANVQDGSRVAALRPSFLYNLGRVVSYTAVGGIVGALGSVFTLTGSFRGAIQLIAGVFMVIMGINMLGIFPWLRRLTPRMPSIFARKIDAEKGKSKSPLIIGLLNGLMPCGPLQAMQIYALSTGSPVTGALSMLLFSLGTVPLMFGLGALSSVLSKKFTGKVMAVGAALVVMLGLSMFSQGWSLSGLSLDFLEISAAGGGRGTANAAEAVMEDGFQIVNSTLQPGRYPAITVQAGTPVKWTINAPQGSINGCNNRMFIREYGIEHQFKTGENVIEFTPTTTGKFAYSCWMGMIRSSITVVEGGAAPGRAATKRKQ
jgi:sulfite exporter TauE/SafE